MAAHHPTPEPKRAHRSGDGSPHRAQELSDVTLPPGTDHLALDTFVSATPKPGEYLLAILDH